jgi:hypothetical protein
MKYESGYVAPRVRWVRMDGRNKMVEHYSHRITVRDRQQGLKMELWFIENMNFGGSFQYWEPKYGDLYKEGLYAKPRIYKQRETYVRSNFYLNEEDLVQFVVGFQP